jgi:hypothetical protein
MVSGTPGKKRRNGRAAFKAVELEVRAALTAGWTLVAIFEEKKTRLGMSYAQFARYAQPLREASRAGLLTGCDPQTPLDATLPPAIPRPRAPGPASVKAAPVATAAGPPKGRPEDAIPKLNMDDFAARVKGRKLI